MVTMYEVAMNSAVLKTREGLQWLINYNREALHDGCTSLANKNDVMDVMSCLISDISRCNLCRCEIDHEWGILDYLFGFLPF